MQLCSANSDDFIKRKLKRFCCSSNNNWFNCNQKVAIYTQKSNKSYRSVNKFSFTSSLFFFQTTFLFKWITNQTTYNKAVNSRKKRQWQAKISYGYSTAIWKVWNIVICDQVVNQNESITTQRSAWALAAHWPFDSEIETRNFYNYRNFWTFNILSKSAWHRELIFWLQKLYCEWKKLNRSNHSIFYDYLRTARCDQNVM